MLLKTSNGGNVTWTTSSTSAGFECKLNFVHIFCNLFAFHFFLFTPVPNGARHFLAYRLDSTRLDSTRPWTVVCQMTLEKWCGTAMCCKSMGHFTRNLFSYKYTRGKFNINSEHHHSKNIFRNQFFFGKKFNDFVQGIMCTL